jgi:hypothetical protein
MIYVDTPFDGWCHMVADSLEELHEFALKMGINPERFQNKPKRPHYDLRPKRRRQAVNMGAIEVQRKVLMEVLQKNYGV